MRLHSRGILSVVQARLARRPIAVLTGVRQTGKATLVRELPPGVGGPATVYFSLDDPDEQLRLAADPVRRLDHGERLVVFDEVQRQPDLLDVVKFLADRRRGHRFLLLDSSRILLLQKVRETLAGRATLLEPWPLALVEPLAEEDLPAAGLDLVWRDGEDGLEKLERAPLSADEVRRRRACAGEHRRWGGYPALEGLAEEDRTVWLRDFRGTYLQRDLAAMARMAGSTSSRSRRTFSLSARRNCFSTRRWRASSAWRSTAFGRTRVFLESSSQVVLLPPLLPTVTARLVKSPKLYWTDLGLAHVPAEGAQAEVALFETFVLAELLRWRSWQQDPPALHSIARGQAGKWISCFTTASASKPCKPRPPAAPIGPTRGRSSSFSRRAFRARPPRPSASGSS